MVWYGMFEYQFLLLTSFSLVSLVIILFQSLDLLEYKYKTQYMSAHSGALMSAQLT